VVTLKLLLPVLLKLLSVEFDVALPLSSAEAPPGRGPQKASMEERVPGSPGTGEIVVNWKPTSYVTSAGHGRPFKT